MTTYLQDFAHGLIARHGSRTAGMILHAFTNLGNIVPGGSQDEQLAHVEGELRADDRFSLDETNPGRGGAWVDHKKTSKSDAA